METNQAQQQDDGAKTDEITDYLGGINQLEAEGYEEGVKKARNALFWAAGLLFAGEMIALARAGFFDTATVAFAVIAAGIFIALAFWTKKKPYTAIILGIVVFLAHWLLAIVANGIIDGAAGVGKAIIGGIIVRIIIMVNLIRGLGDAKQLQRTIEERDNVLKR
jgi:hypothetical protein